MYAYKKREEKKRSYMRVYSLICEEGKEEEKMLFFFSA
jgi:hypothetical protein